MKPHLRFLIVTLILTGLMGVSLRADNYFSNADLKDGVAGWHGDGQATFLKPDGTEGADGDPGVIPVIKVTLSSGESHFVYQEVTTRDKPTAMHVKVEVFASSDFQRSTHADDYTMQWKAGGTWYWSGIVVPNVDFWIRGGSSDSWFYKLASLKPGAWTTVDGHFEGLPTDEDRTICFCIPPGHGTIYFKNPMAEAQ